MTPKKVIFDNDLGIDDAMALLFLHASEAIDLIGICTSVGNAPLELTTRNCLYMKERFGISAPVYKGADTGLNGTNPLPPPGMIHGDDGLGNINPSVVSAKAGKRTAVDYLIDQIKALPHEITIIAVGRLTNVAMALQQAPEIASLIKELIIMGGATGRNGHGGNISPVAEANIFGDPLAADQVFSHQVPITMVGLDVTHEVVMSEALFSQIQQQCGEMGEFIHQISRIYTGFHRQWRDIEGCYVHDASAAIYAVAPQLFTVERGQIRVATSDVALGQTVFSAGEQTWFIDHWQDRPIHQVCVGVDASGVLNTYLDTLKNYQARVLIK